ncbi:Exodeoxyribonuclease V, alpha subunit [Desulfamplus magnetovallimortis]|uniref:Exodeoxyribonuclease V, alpha subunit n=1 Tax=Desulfamplus magnetovallimortis TaxID=1246637 RepID=A0A1W1HBI2_9BACT|nr:exodeoxyribonuclease V subunit alpha [Desulfamplus magnetovallimortis]SLM29861.1 Exodeoxyribonuclease V, alpha subunit [Desulfamplus magnetovallimortis]
MDEKSVHKDSFSGDMTEDSDINVSLVKRDSGKINFGANNHSGENSHSEGINHAGEINYSGERSDKKISSWKYLLELLNRWTEHGWLRPLDRAFALFLKEQEPATSGIVLLTAALASHQLGRGHVCLDLAASVSDPDATLSLPPEGESGDEMPARPSMLLSEISLEQWVAELSESRLVALEKIASKSLCQETPATFQETPATFQETAATFQETAATFQETPVIFQETSTTFQKTPAIFQELPATSDNDNNQRPLVLCDGRLYLRRYWRYTVEVGEGISHLINRNMAVPEDLSLRIDRLFYSLRTESEHKKEDIHWQSIAAAIAAKYAFCVISGGPGTGKTTTVVQLSGLLQEMALEQGTKLRIRLAAPTGKAAARLTESIGEAVNRLPEEIRPFIPTEVTTLHRLLGSRPGTRHFIHHSGNKLHLDLLVVDEASMIDLEMMAAIVNALPEKARLVLLGDKDQLASVEAGSVLGDLCRYAGDICYSAETIKWLEAHTGYSIAVDENESTGTANELSQHIVVLRKSHRFGENSGIGALSRAVNCGDSTLVQKTWNKCFADISQFTLSSGENERFAAFVMDGTPEIFLGIDSEDKISFNSEGFQQLTDLKPEYCRELSGRAGYRLYLEKMKEKRFDDAWLMEVLEAFNRFQILTPLRKGEWGVEGLNQRTALMLYKAGLISATDGWYPGRPVMVTRNDYSLGLMNGDIGILLPVDGRNTLKVVFPIAGNVLKKVLPSRLNDVETVFAMTVHKSQGSEFDHTALVLPDSISPVMTRELVYTGITRAKSWFTLVGPKPGILGGAVMRRAHRASGLWEHFI